MMRQKDTTTYPVQFLLVSNEDHITGKTGLTPTVTVSKNGGGFGAAAGAVSELANGVYSWAGNATDRNTLGELMVHISASGADPVDMKILIVDFDPFSAVGAILADTGTDGVVLKAAGLSADAVVEIQSGLATTQHVQEVEDKIDIIDGVVDAVKAKTDMITTGTAITIVSPVSGSTITAIRGDTLVAVLENIGALVGYSNIWFTVKDYHTDPDTASIIQIEKTAGLLYINGAAASDPENGSLVVTDEASGDVTINLAAVETAQLSPRSYYYDIQILLDTGVINTLIIGIFDVLPDYTRSIGEQSL